VASIWGVSRYVDGATVCLLFEATFAHKFAPYLLYGGFSKIGMDSFDWYVKRCDFDSVAIATLKNEVVKLDFHRPVGAISSLVVFKDTVCPMPPPVSIDAKLFVDSLWFERWLRLQQVLPGCSTKILDAEMLRRWGRKLYKPWELDSRLISCITLVARPVNHVRSQVSFGDWSFKDWMDFFDLIDGDEDVIGINVPLANLRKCAYGFPSNWNPSRVVEYCRRFNLPPLGYPDNFHSKRPKVNEIPFQLDVGTIQDLEVLKVVFGEGRSVHDSGERCGSDAIPTDKSQPPSF
jgi:hypothetical protein